MDIVPLKKYCEMEGVGAEAVKARLRNGTWRLGREIVKIKGFRGYYIDLVAVESFLRDPKNQEK